MNSVKLLGNRVLVKRWPEVDQHESGLWLPSDAREKPQLGDVLAIGRGVVVKHGYGTHFTILNGQGVDLVIPDLMKGEVVIFEKLVSLDYQVTIESEEFLVLPYSKLYGSIQGLIRQN